jgi:hypothetical protein
MAQTAPAVPFVLHRKRIGKGAMKKFGIDCQRRIDLLFFNWRSHDEWSSLLSKLRQDCLGLGA